MKPKQKPRKKPEIIELDADELQAKLNEIEQTMGEETARPFRQLLSWYLSLLALIERKNTSIRRLRQLLFGPRTERTRDLKGNADASTDSAGEPDGATPADHSEASDPSRLPSGDG